MADDDDERVGYKMPPRRTRFQPGKSGNPAGRPKDALSMRSALSAELGEEVTVRAGAKEIKISRFRAFLRTIVDSAIGGDMRAAAILNSMCARAFPDEQSGDSATGMDDAEIIRKFLARERAKQSEPENEDSR